MRDDATRRRDTGGHEKRRPVQRVLTDDLFADEVCHRRPILRDPRFGFRGTRTEAERGEVIRQRVEPHIHHVLRITGDRNAPCERRATDAEVL